MKVCVVGAGAIGGLLAVKLAFAGETVSVIDRGAHLSAIRSKGLHLHWQDGTIARGDRMGSTDLAISPAGVRS